MRKAKDSLAALKATSKERIEKLASQGQAETEDTRFLSARVSKALVKEVRLYCVQNDISVKQFIEDAVRARLKSK